MTSPKKLVVIGGGEHARVLIEAAQSRPGEWDVLGFIDPAPADETAARLGIRRLGEDEGRLCAEATYRDCSFVLGFGRVGRPEAQRRSVERCRIGLERWATVVHSHAWVSPTARLGRGVVVMAGAVINSGANVGDHVVLNTGAVIEHDVSVGAFTHIGPGTAIGGGAAIGDDCYLGLGCRVRDHVRIERSVIVGMGAVVVRSVGECRTVLGVPARVKETTRGCG